MNTITILSCLTCQNYWSNVANVYSTDLGFILGLIGTLGVIVFLVYFLFSPIKRDTQLVKKNYWFWVLVFMVTLIFAMQLWGVMYHVWEQIPSNRHHSTDNQILLRNILHFFIGSLALPQELQRGGIPPTVMLAIKVFIVNGISVATIVSLFNRRITHYREGQIRYSRLIYWLLQNKYAVVIGANEVAASVIKNLLKPCEHKADYKSFNCYCDRKLKYILLQTNRKAEEVRKMLASHLTDHELDRVIIYTANRDSKKELQKLYMEYAHEIHILGEQTVVGGAEAFHDTINMKCLNLVAQILRDYKNAHPSQYQKKHCRVMFEYQTTHSVFQFSDVSDDVRETLDFEPFNRYESWARKVLVGNAVDTIKYVPLESYKGITYDSNKHVHLIVVGMSNMGTALGVQALFQAHYPNYVRDSQLKTRVTFIDTKADKEMAFFKGRYATLFELARHRYIDANACKEEDLNSDYGWVDPMQQSNCQWKHLSNKGQNFLDVEIEFVKGELESDGVRKYLTQVSKIQTSKLTIAICLTNASQAIAASLYMPMEVYENQQLQQILVYQREASTIIENISKETKKNSIRYKKLRPFGMIYSNYMDDRTRYWKGVLTNAVYNATKDNKPLPLDLKNTDDKEVKALVNEWDELKECKKISNKLFVDSIYQKLRCIMDLSENETLGEYGNPIFDNRSFVQDVKSVIQSHTSIVAKCEHNRWNVEQLLMGFTPMKSADDEQFRQLVDENNEEKINKKKSELKESSAKVHPNICDFEHLNMVDPGAKKYDYALNVAIPDILIRVDGYEQFVR